VQCNTGICAFWPFSAAPAPTQVINATGQPNLSVVPANATSNPIITINNNNDTSNNNQVHINLTSFKIFDPEFYKLFAHTSAERITQVSRSLLDWLIQNKIRATAYAVGATYCTLQCYLRYLTFCLTRNNCWSNWQSQKTLEQLYTITQSNFAHLLITDIQRQYTTIDNPTDFVTPLIAFMHDTEREYKQLAHYIQIVDLHTKLYIDKVCLHNAHLFAGAPERMQRLSFMKNTFLSWLADYKLNQSHQQAHKKLLALHGSCRCIKID
jgi:hypothetical protein